MKKEARADKSPRLLILILSSDDLPEQAAELRGARLVAGEDFLEVYAAEVLRRDLAEHVAEVCRQSEVSALEELVVAKSRPLAVDTSAAHRTADDEHRVGVSVVCAACAVLSDCATELRHRQHDNVLHARGAEVCRERVDALRELREKVRELSARAALCAVRVPSAYIREGDFQTDARLDELRNLHQGASELSARIARAVLGLVLRGVHLLQEVYGLERLFARSAQHVVDALLVDALEAALHARRLRAAAYREVAQVLHRERGSRALKRAREVLRHRDRAERSGLRVGSRLQVAVEPPVLR